MPVASIFGSSWLTRVRSGRRRPTRRSPVAWKTARERTTPSPHSLPSFAMGDPNAPPLDSESLRGQGRETNFGVVRASAGARPLDRPSEDEAEHRGGDGDAVAPEEAHQGTGHGGREPGGAAEAAGPFDPTATIPRLTRLVGLVGFVRMNLQYSMHDARARFSEVIRHVREGKTVTVSRRGEPVAEIRPVPRSSETIEERLDELERRGALVRSGRPWKPPAPVTERPGALDRFLADRNE